MIEVTVTFNEEKERDELFFSKELPKETATFLKEKIGLRQHFKSPKKWLGNNHPAYQNYVQALEEALAKGAAIESVPLLPSFEPSLANINQNRFSYVTISFGKENNIKQEDYVVFDPFKKVSTFIAESFGRQKFGSAFKKVRVFPKKQKVKARALFKEGKILTAVANGLNGEVSLTNVEIPTPGAEIPKEFSDEEGKILTAEADDLNEEISLEIVEIPTPEAEIPKEFSDEGGKTLAAEANDLNGEVSLTNVENSTPGAEIPKEFSDEGGKTLAAEADDLNGEVSLGIVEIPTPGAEIPKEFSDEGGKTLAAEADDLNGEVSLTIVEIPTPGAEIPKEFSDEGGKTLAAEANDLNGEVSLGIVEISTSGAEIPKEFSGEEGKSLSAEADDLNGEVSLGIVEIPSLETENPKELSNEERKQLVKQFIAFATKREEDFPKVHIDDHELPILFSVWLRHNYPNYYHLKGEIWPTIQKIGVQSGHTGSVAERQFSRTEEGLVNSKGALEEPKDYPELIEEHYSDYLDRVIAHMHDDYAENKRVTKGQVEKLAKALKVLNMGIMWEAVELSWMLWYRALYREPIPFEHRLAKMIHFWHHVQPTYAYSDSSKEIYKQYSTPCPIGAIVAEYTGMKNARRIFEPSAGNGLLLVGADPAMTHANEIDKTRIKSLEFVQFSTITSFNAAEPFGKALDRSFDVVVTNPPFSRWEEEKYDKVHIIETYFHNHIGLAQNIRLEHVMSGLALHTMKDNGRAAIIIMGYIYFGEDGLIAKYRPFFNWLFRHYKVDDVINLNSFKLYNKQGAIEKTMLILISGRKPKPEGVAPQLWQRPEFNEMVNSFEELWQRVNPRLINQTQANSQSKGDIDQVIEQLKNELEP
ncbi:MAG: N-6 DNA methylase [Cytophagales bacterium]|nr:N-6 DNA methylase [Cytophagales bacterium]